MDEETKTIYGKIKTMAEALESSSAPSTRLAPSPSPEKIPPSPPNARKAPSPPISEDALDELLPLEEGGHVFVREQAPRRSSSRREELKEEIFPELRQARPKPEFQPARPVAGPLRSREGEASEAPPNGGPKEAGPPPAEKKNTEDVPANLPGASRHPTSPAPAGAGSGTTQHPISPAPTDAELEAPLETPEEILGIGQPAKNLPQTDDETPHPPQSLPADAAHQVPQASENLEEKVPLETPEKILGIEQEQPLAPANQEEEQASPEKFAPSPSIDKDSRLRQDFGGQVGDTQPKELAYEPEGGEGGSTILNLLMFWHGNRPQTIMIGSIIVVAAIIVGSSFYFIFAPGEPEEPPMETQDIPEVTFTPPAPFATPDFIQEIVIEDFQKTTILQILAALKGNEYPTESTTYLPIRLSETAPEGQAQYLGGELFLNNLDIRTPQNFFNVVEPQFMLYLYSGGEEEKQMCQENNMSDKDCWGVRLGMAFKAKEGRSDELKSLLTNWIELENTNLESLILADSQVETPIYKTGEYKGIEIKYTNLPLSTMSLDFAIVDNLLILATSKNSLTSMLDKI